jgi:hypothetical protein
MGGWRRLRLAIAPALNSLSDIGALGSNSLFDCSFHAGLRTGVAHAGRQFPRAVRNTRRDGNGGCPESRTGKGPFRFIAEPYGRAVKASQRLDERNHLVENEVGRRSHVSQ